MIVPSSENKLVIVKTRDGYEQYKGLGYEPLLDLRFLLSISLRVELQVELFGSGHTPRENERFYRFCWEHYPHRCMETMRPLHEYSAVYVSHILARGAYPEIAHDPRNVNILCYEAHAQWENGDREKMRIYRSNLIRIERLKEEYKEFFKK